MFDALINGTLREEIYLEITHSVDMHNKSGDSFRLREALYGLKQTALVWYEKKDRCLEELGFNNSVADRSLYVRARDHEEIYLFVYVCDVLLVRTNRK